MTVTRAIAPTSRRRARFLSCISSSLIDLAMAVRNLCLTLAFAHYRSNRKKGSENDDFIISSRRITGGAPCGCDVWKFLSGCRHARARECCGEKCRARAPRAAAAGEKPVRNMGFHRRDDAVDVLVLQHREYGQRAAAGRHAGQVRGERARRMRIMRDVEYDEGPARQHLEPPRHLRL